MTHALLFDLDGTLSDTHGLARATWLEVLRPHGIDVDFQFYQEHIRGRSDEEAVRDLFSNLSDKEREQLLETHGKNFHTRMMAAGPLPGLHDFLNAAKQRGFKLVLVTNAPEHVAHEALHPLDLDEAFDLMVFAEEAGATKPDPAPYELALQRLGIGPNEGLALEDSPKGVQAARKVGLSVIGILATHHPAELRDAGATLVIGDYMDAALYDVLDDPDSLRR